MCQYDMKVSLWKFLMCYSLKIIQHNLVQVGRDKMFTGLCVLTVIPFEISEELEVTQK